MKIWVIVHKSDHETPGSWHATALSNERPIEAIEGFLSEQDAWLWLLGENPTKEDKRLMEFSWDVIPLISVEAALQPPNHP